MNRQEILLKSKYTFKNIAGEKAFYFLRNFISKYTTKRMTVTVIAKPRKKGINLIGPLSTIGGLGSAVRSLEESCVANGITVNKIDFNKNLMKKRKVITQKTVNNTFFVNIVCANADQTQQLLDTLGPSFFEKRYTVGYWMWEQDDFPDYWTKNFDFYDEIWTSSKFSQKALQKKTNKPVSVVHLSVNPHINKKYSKRTFRIAKNEFVFLFVCDFLSGFERKNPLGVIESFKNTSHAMPHAKLIIKTVNSQYDSKNFQKMICASQGYNIKILTSYLENQKLYSLFRACDCYISLHKAEGFGYTVFEAMSFGKPVIVTNYSGVCDFVTNKNSFLVNYKRQKLKHSYGSYKKGTYWVQPDLKQAEKLMIEVYKNTKLSKQISKNGKKTVKEKLHPKVVGKIIFQKLAAIENEQLC